MGDVQSDIPAALSLMIEAEPRQMFPVRAWEPEKGRLNDCDTAHLTISQARQPCRGLGGVARCPYLHGAILATGDDGAAIGGDRHVQDLTAMV